MGGGEVVEVKCSESDWDCWTGAADVDGTSRIGQREEKIKWLCLCWQVVQEQVPLGCVTREGDGKRGL